jgi:hypothetical protein
MPRPAASASTKMPSASAASHTHATTAGMAAAASMCSTTATATSAASGGTSSMDCARNQDRYGRNGQEMEFRHNTLLKRPERQEVHNRMNAHGNAHEAPRFPKAPMCSSSSSRSADLADRD